MKSDHEPTFLKILETDSLTDIALIKSVLDAEGVEYYIQGEHLMYLRQLDPAVLMVTKDEAEKAVRLLKPLKLTYKRMTFK